MKRLTGVIAAVALAAVLWSSWSIGADEGGVPGFGAILSGTEIEAVLAYIKSTWPRARAPVPRGGFRGGAKAAQ